MQKNASPRNEAYKVDCPVFIDYKDAVNKLFIDKNRNCKLSLYRITDLTIS